MLRHFGEVKPFSFEKYVSKASSTIVKIVVNNEKTAKLLAGISWLEKKLSIECQAFSEETTVKFELQHKVKTLYKECKVVSDELEKRVERPAKLTQNVTTKSKQEKEQTSGSGNKQN